MRRTYYACVTAGERKMYLGEPDVQCNVSLLVDKTVVHCVHIQIMLWAHPGVASRSSHASAPLLQFQK